MIIKFRENTIQTLRQTAEGGPCELEKDSHVVSTYAYILNLFICNPDILSNIFILIHNNPMQ